MTDENLEERTPIDTAVDESAAESADESTSTQGPPQYGVGPFSLREVILGGVWLVAFVVSFFPVNLLVGQSAALFGGANVWVSGLSWVLTIGLPTVAVFLIVLRRLSPQGIPRVGSLGIDQFASVAFSVATILWLQSVWETVAIAFETGIWVRSWVIWVELFLMLAGVVLTVFAPFLPALEQDFQDRAEVPAHRNARAIRPVVPRPKVERPAPAAPAPDATPGGDPYAPGAYDSGVVYDPAGAPQGGYDPAAYGAPANDTGAYAGPTNDSGAYGTHTNDTGAYGTATNETGGYRTPTADTGSYGTDVFAPLNDTGAQPTAEEWAPATDDTIRTTQIPAQAPQAFWALVPVERDVVDDYGSPVFRIGPTAWALVIEDRGEAFVVRHEDGRVGFLHDLTGVTRG